MNSTLAINGGNPVRSTPMPAREAFGELEYKSLITAVEFYRSNQQDPPYQNKYEQLFCDGFSEFMGGGYTDAVATGTAAVFIALAALDLPKGSEVIISPVTDSGPLNAIIMQGLKPVLADSAMNSYNLGVEQFLERVTPNTSCLLAVDSAGEPLEIEAITKEAHQRGIKVLEDCSQAPGALDIANGQYHRHSPQWEMRRVGHFGDIAAFSTMYRKSIAAGASGGLVYSSNKDLYHNALAHADRGKQSWRTDINLSDPSLSLFPALNWNTDELSCAIGHASLSRLQQTIDKRVAFTQQVIHLINEQSTNCSPYSFHDGFSPFYFPIFVDTENLCCTKTEFAEALAAEGIPVNTHYGCVISSWEFAKPYMADSFVASNAENTRDRSFNLFLHENYGDQEAQDIVTAIVKLEKAFS